MTTYRIDKPEKGAGILEYILKYLTIFIVVGFLIWAILIFCMTNGTIGESVYMFSLYLSFGITTAFIIFLIKRKVNTNRQGTIYRIDFDNSKKTVTLHLFNEFKGSEFQKSISYSNLRIEEKIKKIDVKAEQKLKIYDESNLINVFNIPKTGWTVYPRIALIVETFREIVKK